MQDIILKVRNLSKKFNLHLLGGKVITAFQNASFVLKRGEFLGISGKSGSGKSSLIKCIYRTYLSTEGEIVYYPKNGMPIDLARCLDEEIIDLRHRKIGYVSQFFYAIPRVSCLKIVTQTLIQQGVDEDGAKRRAKNMLLRLLIPERLFDAYPSTFSGGERQRVNIAQALVKKAELLLLDEPTASLDKTSRAIVLDEILKLKKKGISVIGIFHDDEELKRFADRILVLEEGKIKEIYKNDKNS
ncbi:MAG: ATP-binding cassette domain-containing protein [Candidatus Omnitrophica bacterium]|nr:ATP-binding cassette domain-containing protein [Candidatus Omnitrophota bacterium]